MYDAQLTKDGIAGGHYVTITKLCIDKIYRKTYVRIASWGDDYWVDLDGFINGNGMFITLIFYEVH